MKYYSMKVRNSMQIGSEILSAAMKETERRVKHNSPVFFIKNITKEFVDMTVIVTNPYMVTFDEIEDTSKFLRSIGMEDFEEDEIIWYEIGRELATHELETAEIRGLVHDANDILWNLGIQYSYNDKRWGEGLVEGAAPESESLDKGGRSEIMQIPGNQPLIEELNRLEKCESSTSEIIMHPVHYVIESDSEKDRRTATISLIKAAVEAEKVYSTRYMHFKATVFGNERDEWEANPAELFDEYVGGCAVIDFTCEESIEYLIEEGHELAESIYRHKDDVLSILLLPEKSEEIKELLAPYFKEMQFVPMLCTEMTGLEAKEYVISQCSANGVTLTKKDLGRLNDTEIYPVSFVKEVVRGETKRERSSEDYKNEENAFKKYNGQMNNNAVVEGELFELVGQDEILEEARAIIKRAKVENALKSRGLNVDAGPMQFAFTGDPGTGKTSAAYLLARELYKEGLLSTDKVIEAGRKSIIGKYMGETTKNARQLFAKAHGKVLFIDEAYSLCDTKSGSAYGYGKEAIDVIVEELGKPCSDRVVIMAGYPDEMKELLESNPGLKSRINYHISFKNYSTEELLGILELHVERKGMNLDPKVRGYLTSYLDRARSIKGFGNGRFVVNLLGKAIVKQRLRLYEIGIDKLDSLGEEELMKLTVADFEDVEKMLEEVSMSAKVNCRRVGLRN